MDTEDDSFNVHLQQDTAPSDTMICEITRTLDSAHSDDLAELLRLFKEFGAISHKASVSDVRSADRVSALAGRMGLQRGFIIDFTIVDPDDGKPWDFDVPAKREKALHRVLTEKPLLIIGSPMCTPIRVLMKLSQQRQDTVMDAHVRNNGHLTSAECRGVYKTSNV